MLAVTALAAPRPWRSPPQALPVELGPPWNSVGAAVLSRESVGVRVARTRGRGVLVSPRLPRLDLVPINRSVGLKAKPSKPVTEVLRPVAAKYGLRLNELVARLVSDQADQGPRALCVPSCPRAPACRDTVCPQSSTELRHRKGGEEWLAVPGALGGRHPLPPASHPAVETLAVCTSVVPSGLGLRFGGFGPRRPRKETKGNPAASRHLHT